jgi:hypothetical protein
MITGPTNLKPRFLVPWRSLPTVGSSPECRLCSESVRRRPWTRRGRGILASFCHRQIGARVADRRLDLGAKRHVGQFHERQFRTAKGSKHEAPEDGGARSDRSVRSTPRCRCRGDHQCAGTVQPKGTDQSLDVALGRRLDNQVFLLGLPQRNHNSLSLNITGRTE